MRLPKFINKTLSIRLSLMAVCLMAVLLLVSMTIMLFFSRKAIKEEALQKAMQTLEGTVQQIDNILLSVEQSTGNLYFNMMPHLDDPDKVTAYCLNLVKSNKFVDGCAIVFKPYYYKDREFFMSYFHQTKKGVEFTDSPIIQSETFGNCPYTEQVWYTKPMASARAGWMYPLEETEMEGDALITFCLPIPGNDGQPVGVIGVDVSLSVLSQIIQTTKPSRNSYCTLLARDGSYIVHPDSSKLRHKTVFQLAEQAADPSVKQAAEAMVSGETGNKSFRMNGTDYYVFYKPFTRNVVPGRSMERLNWSVGIVYPENDIMGDYNRLIYYVLGIAIVGLLMLFILCRTILHHQLHPLTLLTTSAQRITDGNYDEIIPDSQQKDEIGSLQNHFQQMQQSLAANMSELEGLKETLQKRGEELRAAYEEAKQAERMKTAFLHNMTHQMAAPADTIFWDVETLCNDEKVINEETASHLADNIKKKGDRIAHLLDDLLHVSEKETKKGGIE